MKTNTATKTWFLALTGALALFTLSTCGPTGGGPMAPPTVVSNSPLAAATGVALNESVSAQFSEAMETSSLSSSTFKLTAGSSPTPIAGRVIYANKTATFWPTVHFASGTVHTATLTTGVKSASGTALARDHVWTFTTGTTVAPGRPVSLGTAVGFVILAKAGISTVPTSAVTGDLGVSPAAASYITGFSLTADATNVFSTSPQVTGKVYAADYASPSPSKLTTAVSDMELAFTDAAGRAADVTELGAGNISGMTLSAGVYKWGTGLLIPTNVTLTGNATDVWIFQVAQDLTLASATRVNLSGGALAKNVFWQVSGKVELGTTAHIEGTVLCQTGITLLTGASINGRLHSQTAVAIDGSSVVQAAL